MARNLGQYRRLSPADHVLLTTGATSGHLIPCRARKIKLTISIDYNPLGCARISGPRDFDRVACKRQIVTKRLCGPVDAGECAMAFPVVLRLSSRNLLPPSFDSDGRVLSRDAQSWLPCRTIRQARRWQGLVSERLSSKCNNRAAGRCVSMPQLAHSICSRLRDGQN